MLKRPNLELQLRAQVTRVLFEGTRAVGVEYRSGKGPLKQARAAEVILCGGSINTPQVLELSGVGNAGALAELGIDVVHDLPGVGGTYRTTSRSTSSIRASNRSRSRPRCSIATARSCT